MAKSRFRYTFFRRTQVRFRPDGSILAFFLMLEPKVLRGCLIRFCGSSIVRSRNNYLLFALSWDSLLNMFLIFRRKCTRIFFKDCMYINIETHPKSYVILRVLNINICIAVKSRIITETSEILYLD